MSGEKMFMVGCHLHHKTTMHFALLKNIVKSFFMNHPAYLMFNISRHFFGGEVHLYSK